MNLICNRCEVSFEGPAPIGYCPDCITHFHEVQRNVNRKQLPAPGVCADGKFTDDPGPCSFEDRSGRAVCGMCGSDELSPGYGLGTGRGIGSYTFCKGCNTFRDFVEDADE